MTNTVIAALSVANAVDIAVLALLFIFCVAGTMRGLTGELARLLAISTCVAVGMILYPIVRESLITGAEISWRILAGVATTAAAAAAAALVRWIVLKFLKVIIGQPADSIMGGIFATTTTIIVIWVALFFLYMLPGERIHNAVFVESTTGQIAEPLIVHAQEQIYKEKE